MTESEMNARITDASEEEEEVGELRERAILFLNGEIDQNHLQICATLLNYHFTEDFNEPIQLIINSDGGNCSIGWSIIDVMNFIRLPIHTIALGVVASMAADIFANGDTRTIGEHSTLMIHPHSAVRFGSHSSLLASSRADAIEHNRRLTHYVNNSKYKSTKEVEEKLFTTRGDDLWLTPEEVLEHGLCDEIAVADRSKRRKAFRSVHSDGGKTARIPRKPRATATKTKRPKRTSSR